MSTSGALSGLKNWNTPLRVSDLGAGRAHAFVLEASSDEATALAEALGILGIKKLRASGDIRPLGKRDWELVGTLGATVTQACVVTLAPVSTRIDTPFVRRYLADWDEEFTPESEVEMPEDDTAEPLPATLTLSDVVAEALSLALPDYPRADGAELGAAQFTEAGKDALTDETVKPFASLAALRDKLAKDTGPDGENDPE